MPLEKGRLLVELLSCIVCCLQESYRPDPDHKSEGSAAAVCACVLCLWRIESYLWNCSHALCAVCRNRIDLILNTKVKAVQRQSVTVSDASGERDIPFGACVWATGVAMHPVIRQASASGRLLGNLVLSCSHCSHVIVVTHVTTSE